MAYKDSFKLTQHVGLGEGKDLNGCVSEVTFGAIHQISVDIRGEDMPKADADSLTIRAAKLPVGCAVLSAILVVEKPAHTPGSTLSVGTVKLNGQGGSATALIESANTSAGVKNGAGALLDTVIEGESENPNDDDLYIKITTAADAEALAGLKAKLIVEYV